MLKLRNALLIAVTAATSAAGIGGYFLLQGPPARLIVDASLAVALAVIVTFMLTPTMNRVDGLVDALRALARGDRHRRVDPEEFAGLADVARAVNEVAASLTDGDDPNLGPVRSTPRPGRPSTGRREGQKDGSASDHPEIGPVRVVQKVQRAEKTGLAEGSAERGHRENRHPVESAHQGAERTESAARSPSSDAAGKVSTASATTRDAASPTSTGATSAAESVVHEERPSEPSGAPSEVPSEMPSDAPPASGPAPLRESALIKAAVDDSAPLNGSERSESPSSSHDTSIDELKRSNGGSAEAEVAKTPSRAELEALFQEFVAAKKSKDESLVDLDLEAFTQTIQGECERLIAAHQCKGVRFEVTLADGEVSLRPRLLR